MIIRIILMLIGIAGIVVFFLPMGRKGIANAGNITGLIVSVLVLLFGTFSWLFSRVTKIVLLVLVLLILILVILINNQMTKAKRNIARNQEVVIVLGSTNKYYISDIMNARIKEAARYLDKHDNAICIACGGIGSEYYKTEAEYIAVELAKYGIPKSRIITETTSINTYENMMNAKKIIEERNLSKLVAIATSDFHQYRAGINARQARLHPYAINTPTEKYLYPTYFVKEMLAILIMPIRKR
ncbi:MAG: YdcF family protein [Lachnospiraceae bacterium]|nr:YdcF family protein [Lachnospiraceae bacterium]